MLKVIRILLIICTLLLNINYSYCFYNSNNKIISFFNTTKYNISINNDFDSIDKNIKVIGNKVYLPKISKKGYKNNGFRVNNNIINNTVLISNINNKKLIPIWELNTYNINYDLDGGINNNKNTYTTEDNFILNKPIKEGYKFIGWTGSNGNIPEEEVIINNMYGDKYYKANYILEL